MPGPPMSGQNFGGFSQVGRPLWPPCRGAAAGDRTPAGASRSVKQAGTFMQRRVGQRDSLRQGFGSMPGRWAVVCLPPFCFLLAGLQHASTAGQGEKCVGYLTRAVLHGPDIAFVVVSLERLSFLWCPKYVLGHRALAASGVPTMGFELRSPHRQAPPFPPCS